MTFIPEDFFNEYYEIVDELYTNDFVSEKIRLYYILKENCPNCIPGNPNKYKSGGSIPFSFGPCPFCDGKNYLETETTEEIKLRVYEYNRKKSNSNIGNVTVNSNELYVIGKIEDYPKLKKCDYFLIFSNTLYGDWKFTLDSDPLPFGFGSSQFKTYIKRL